MRPFAIIAALMLVGCADTSTSVNVAPSAHDSIELIAGAVDELNWMLGEEVYTVRMVDREHRVDDQIIVRVMDGPLDGRPNRRGDCQPTLGGVIVRLSQKASDVHIAHELGHAAGLGHHPDEHNLMYKYAAEWELTEKQMDVMRGAR